MYASQIKSYRELETWQVAMKLVTQTYALCDELPSSERFELRRQMHRAAVSVPSNIAEGQIRNSSRSFIHFIGIALGSIAELDTHVEIAVRLKYFSITDVSEILQTIQSTRRLLFGLRRAQRLKLTVSGGASILLMLLAVRFFV